MTILNFPKWITNAIFYQIFPDRFYNGDRQNDPPLTTTWTDLPTRENFFGGDLQGILEKLDYLQDLGINALYLTPIFKARTNHKYDVEDYFQVDPAFGTNKLLGQLINEIHNHDMHIIIDGVFNHCGQEFEGFQDLINLGEKSAFRDWFYVNSFPIQTKPLSYMTCGETTYLPKFNYDHRPVRDFVLKVGRFWLEEFGIDGWRLDMPFKVPIDFWREFRMMAKSINPNVYLVGEVWRDAWPWIQGDVFDGTTNYELRNLLLDYCLYQLLDAEDFAYETEVLNQKHGQSAKSMLNLLGSHDTPRLLTIFKGDICRAKIALTYLFTTPGVPLIYYGDELGMIGENDPDCRRPMRWEDVSDVNPMFALTRQLIQLRREHPSTQYGMRKKLLAFNGLFVYQQYLYNDELIVLLNPRCQITNVRIQTDSKQLLWKDVNSSTLFENKNGFITISNVPSVSSIILEPQGQ